MDGIGHAIPSTSETFETWTAQFNYNLIDVDYDLAYDLFVHIFRNLENNSASLIMPHDTDWESQGVLKRFL